MAKDTLTNEKARSIMDALKKQMEDVQNRKPVAFYNRQFEEILTKLAVHNEYNFYAHVLFNMHAKLSYDVPTAGIYYKNDSFHIDVNPVFIFETLMSPMDRLALFIHEVLHALYFHFARSQSRDHQLWNLAGDLCINQFLFKKLESDSVLKQIGCDLGEKFNFPKNLTAEKYYELLKEDKEQNPEKYEGGGSGEIYIEDLLESDAISDVEKEMIKDQLKDIVKRAKDKAIGNLPDEILEIIDVLFAPPVVDWRNVLRDVTGNKRINKETTIKRRARRFQNRVDINGKVKRSGFNVACLVDVSGSMSNEEIVQGLSEIKSICDWSSSTMTLVQVDTEATEPEEFSGFTRTFDRKRSGGTYLYPGVERLDEYEIDYNALIVITDGEIENHWPEVLDIPVFFLTTSGHLHFDISVSPLYKRFDLEVKR